MLHVTPIFNEYIIVYILPKHAAHAVRAARAQILAYWHKYNVRIVLGTSSMHTVMHFMDGRKCSNSSKLETMFHSNIYGYNAVSKPVPIIAFA